MMKVEIPLCLQENYTYMVSPDIQNSIMHWYVYIQDRISFIM